MLVYNGKGPYSGIQLVDNQQQPLPYIAFGQMGISTESRMLDIQYLHDLTTRPGVALIHLEEFMRMINLPEYLDDGEEAAQFLQEAATDILSLNNDARRNLCVRSVGPCQLNL